MHPDAFEVRPPQTNDRVAMGLADAAEVSIEILSPFRVASERFAGDPNAILGEDAELTDPRTRRIPWAKVVRLYERMEEILPEGETMRSAGALILEAPRFGQLLGALSLLASAKDLIFVGNRFGLIRSFNHLEIEQEVLKDGSIDLEIYIPEAYEDSPGFFEVTAGVIQSLPRLLRMPDAEVILRRSERRGHFHIIPPPSRTLYARILGIFKRLLGVDRLVAELTEQRLDLNGRLDELRTMNSELELAVEARDRFLEVISHELRTPMNSILASSRDLAGQVREPGCDSLQDLQLAAHRLHLTTESILEVSRHRNAQTRATPAPCNPTKLLEATTGRFLVEAQVAGLSLRSHLDPSLPEALLLDRDRVERVLAHLLSNGIKFTDRGYIEVRAGFGDDAFWLEVEDTGRGMSDAEQAHIFTAFRQIEGSQKRRHQGAGLGLTVVQMLAQTLGGQLVLRSEVGVGTTMRFTCPASVGSPPSRAGSDPQVGTVLIVDDDRLNRRVLARALQRRGLRCIQAENGREGTAAAQKPEVTAVIMDYEMPEMDGVEATREVVAARPDLPVFGWTASARPEVRQAMTQAGALDFLDKPLQSHSLEAMLETWDIKKT